MSRHGYKKTATAHNCGNMSGLHKGETVIAHSKEDGFFYQGLARTCILIHLHNCNSPDHTRSLIYIT